MNRRKIQNISWSMTLLLIGACVPGISVPGFGGSGASNGTENLGTGSAEQAVTAEAGSDQTVAPGSTVHLDGSASSVQPEGPLNHAWLQTSGPIVRLSNPSSAQPSFVAPAATGSTQILFFQLTVLSSESSATDRVQVTVLPDYGIGLSYLLWYEMRPHSYQRTQMESVIEELLAMGFTHVTLQAPFASNPEWVQSYRDRGLRIAMSVNLSDAPSGLSQEDDPLAFHQVETSDFPNCIDSNPATACPLDDGPGLCPGYVGVKWTNTLAYLRNSAAILQPELVLIDAEFFPPYSRSENSNPGVIAACGRCGSQEGYEAFRRTRGEEVVDQVIAVAPQAKVLLHSTYNPGGGTSCYRGDNEDDGIVRTGTGDDGWWPAGIRPSNTIPSPEHYALSDLGLVQCNVSEIELDGTVPAISFNWSRGAWRSWDPSLTREAGRLYKQSGIRGLVIWPSWFRYLDNDADLQGWMTHARALAEGLKSVP